MAAIGRKGGEPPVRRPCQCGTENAASSEQSAKGGSPP
jgi:hypothetical protein